MGKGEYFKLPSQTSCVQNIQNEGRKAPFSFLLHYLRLVSYNPDRVLLCLEFDLKNAIWHWIKGLFIVYEMVMILTSKVG